MHALWNWLSHKSELFQVCLCLREWWAGPSHGMWQSKSVPKFSYEIFFTHKKKTWSRGRAVQKGQTGSDEGHATFSKPSCPVVNHFGHIMFVRSVIIRAGTRTMATSNRCVNVACECVCVCEIDEAFSRTPGHIGDHMGTLFFPPSCGTKPKAFRNKTCTGNKGDSENYISKQLR